MVFSTSVRVQVYAGVYEICIVAGLLQDLLSSSL